MRRKFLLSWFLMLLLITGNSSILNAQVAKVGDTEYATIDEAIANWTNGTTLTLLADVTLSDVIQLSSTEYHILDLGTYTMTAASGKDAIHYVVNGRSSASYALDIKADAVNPGGITAEGKTIVSHIKPSSNAPSKDRPITRFYGGVFKASYVVKQGSTNAFGFLTSGYTGASAPYFQFYGGVFNGTIYLNRSQTQFHGGVFNGSIQMSVDSSAYGLVAGGTFKNLSNSMGSALNSDKFTIGTAKGVYNRDVYIDDNGYTVIAAEKPEQGEDGIEADVPKNPGANDYLAYSKVATEGKLGYTDVYTALEKNTTATVTVYVEELDMSEVTNFEGTIVVPEGNDITITNVPENCTVKFSDGTVLIPDGSGNVYTKIEVATLEELKNALAGTSKLPIIIKETIVIPEGEEEVLDLNGKTVKVVESTGNHIYALNNKGNLTIKDSAKSNGSITARGIYNGYNGDTDQTVEGAKMTIESGKFVGMDTNGGAAIFNCAELIIKDGDFTGGVCSVNNRKMGVATIEGGTYHGAATSSYQIQNNGGQLTIKDAYVDSGFGAVGCYSGTTTIEDGTYSPTGRPEATCHVVYVAGGATVDIQGGTFKMNYPDDGMPDSGSAVASYYNGTLTISGGSFTSHFDNVSPVELSEGSEISGGKYYKHSGEASNHVYIKNFLAPGVTLLENGEVVKLFEGEGTATSPYLIASVEKLVALRDDVNAGETYDGVYFKLESDIALTDAWTAIGNGSRSSKTYNGNSFKGVFDGNNKTISGLTITTTTGDDAAVGLFGVVDGGTVKNLYLTDVNINVPNSDLAGAAIGMMLNGATADKITVSGAVTGYDGVGGIVGRLIIDGTISNCINNASVTSSYGGIGGIVGKAYYEDGDNTSTFASVTECTNNGTITAPKYVGGIVGLARANVTECVNNGAVVGGTQTGGIIGQLIAAGTVSANENTAKISGTNHLGGIIGDYTQSNAYTYYNVSIANNINRGEVSATQCAAIMGCNNIDGFTAMTATGNLSYYWHEGLELFATPYDMVIDETNKFILPVAQVGEQTFYTFAEAAEAAQAGSEIILLANIEGNITVPANVTLNGNGFAISGGIIAEGNITFAGVTTADDFDANVVNTAVNIPAGASLQLTGSARLVIGHGATFNITGTIEDAKNANVADLTPSLIMPGASFTGAGVTFNVTNAYISAPSSYCSSSSSASGTFDFNITNSIWESAGKLAFESQSTAATVNFELKDSKLTTGSHLVFGVSRGEVVFDNSNVNVGTSRQIENQSTMTVKNGSVVNGAVATSSNAKNPGTLIVDNATYAVTGEFSGSGLGTGTLIIKKGANVSVGSIKAGANVVVDAEGMAAGDNINFTADLSQFTGTLSVINNDNLEAKIVGGKIVLVEKPVAKIGETEYATLQAALQAAAQTEELTTIQLLAGTHTFGNVKFPATLKNVTIVGADNKETIIKDSKLYSADGNAVTYKGITFDGIVFDNSSILFTGARSGEVVYEDWTIKNCDFRNLQSIDGIAAIHFNLADDETIKNFTFEDNTITNVTSPNNTASGLRMNYVTGNVVIKDNETNNVAFNAVQIINSEVDNFTFEGNILRSNGSSLANLYNVTGENIVITKNQFLVANEDQKGVSNIAYADVSGNYWGGGAPTNLPVGVVYSSYYTTVESDGTLGGLVVLPQGNNFTGYTGVDAIWGEVWGNASESFVIKVLNANGNVMGTTSLNNIGGIIDGDVNVTWSLKLDAASNTDEYWTMEWTTAPKINNMPEINNMPAKVELWVDGVKVSGGDVVLNSPDNLNPIYAAVTDADGKILSYHTSIAAAVAAAQQGNTIALLRNTDEEIKLPFGVTLNLNGFDAPNVTFTLPTAMIGETEYASVADALAAAQAANLADVVITIIGENTAATADNFSLIYENKFDKVTFKQNNGGKVYYFNELYTGSRTNNGEFVFDGVNLVVTGQYMFEGNVKLSNNSFVKSTAEANCFVYYAEVTVEAGSKIDGVIEDIRGGSLIIDGGKTDGTYCSEPGLRDAILTVNWTSSNLVLKNGAYVKVNSANEVGRLTVNGEMRVTDSKLESYQWILVKENATLTLNAGSDITTQNVNGAGNIIVDVTGLEGQATVIKGDMTGFTGTITVNRGFYTVTADGLVVERGLSGKGTEAEPYLINDISDLEFFRDAVNAGNTYAGKYIKLTDDIDLAPTRSGSNWTPIGNSTTAFQGTFDGDNHTISDLVINGGSSSNQGFFGMTTNGEIKNVIFENAKVSGRLNVGVVAGTPYTSKYTNIKVKGHVEVNGMAYVGGVGGKNAYANWTDITVDVDNTSYVKAVSTEDGKAYRTYVGGVIGFNGEGSHTFKNISSNINVIGDVCDIGGIFGIAHYGNNFENIEHSGSVINETNDATEALETGLIAGVWHNAKGTSVTFTNTASSGTISAPNAGVTFPENSLVGAAYTPSNETSGTSGSLVINGETVYPYVAKIGDAGYNTLAKAVTAAQDGETIQLLWTQDDDPIAMNASLYGKNVTITGTATVDWSEGNLFIGRGGVGNATLTFNGANLTSASDNASTGIHVSGREKGTDNKYDGTLVINNSTIDLDYLINKGTMTLDNNSTLIVKNGFSVGGRPASETESGEDATATITLNNNSKVVVNNHNGMGLGYEAIGVMNVNSGSTFETTEDFLITAKGTMNVNGGNMKVDGTLANNGTVYVTGAANLDANVTGNGWFYMNGVALDADTKLHGAKVGFINGENTIVGSTIDNGFFSVGIGQNAAATTAADFAGANGITLGDVTVNVSENAIIGGNGETYSGWVGSAYSADKTQHTYTLNVENSLAAFGYMHVSKDGIMNINGRSADDNKYTQDNSNVNFYAGDLIVNGNVTINNADAWVRYTKMSVDHADGVLNITGDTNYESSIHNGSTTGTSLVFYNAGKVNIANGTTIEIDNATTLVEGAELNIASANVIAKGDVTGNGAINFTALTAKFTAQEDLTIVDKVNNPNYAIAYLDGTYQYAEYVAQIGDEKYLTLQEAVEAAQNDETITLLVDVEQADGVIIDSKNIVVDLNGKTFTVTVGASTSNRNFKITGTSVVTIKNGTMVAAGDYSSGAYGTVRTEGTAKVTLTGLKLYNYRGNGLNIKVLADTEVAIDNTEIYSQYGGGIEAVGGTITLAETVKVEQKGMYTAPYNSMAISVNGGGTVTVNGGTYSTECITAEEAGNQGTSHGPWVVGVLNSGGKLIINGGTFSNDNYGDNNLATAARGAVLADTGAEIEINGGTFNALKAIIDIQNNLGDANNNPSALLSGGTYSADPRISANYGSNLIVVADGYSVKELPNGYYTVIQTKGTQTREFAYPGWYWFSTYIDFESGEEGLDELQEQLGDNAATIKGQTAFTNYQYYNGVPFWTSALTSISASEMYMIKTTNKFDEEEQTYENVSVSLEGDFVDYENYEITIHKGWNWIGYPLNTEVSMTEALTGSEFTPAEGDMIKGKTQGSTSSYNPTLFGGWYPDFNMIPGEGYMYYSAASENKTLTYSAGNGGTQNAKTSVEDNHWIVDEYKYSNNMTVIAMLSIDGEIVKDNYEVAAFANGECRGSARPIYIEALDAYMLFMTIQGEDVENLTFKYYDVNYGTEYELNNTMVYSNDAIVGTIEEPYMFNLGILNIDETSVDQISIYPNPTTTGKEINLQAMCDKVEVFNALGVKVAEYTNVDSIDALETAGIYVIRITIDGNARNCRLVVK